MLINKETENKLMNIVRYINDDRTFYEITSDVLEIIEELLGTSHAYLVQKSPDKTGYNILIKYTGKENDDNQTFINKSDLNILKDSIFYAEWDMDDYDDELALLQAKTCISAPIYLSGTAAMYLLILNNCERHMSKDEIDYVENAVIILETIAQKKVFNKSMISSNEILKNILANIGSGVVVFDVQNNNVLFRNSVAETSEENERVLSAATKELMDGNQLLIPKKIKEFFDAESGLWFDVRFSRLEWLDGRDAVLVTSTDTTLRRKNSTKSTFQAQNDYLTGLFNRMKCDSDMRKVVEQAKANNQTGAILFLDLDNFKNINDSLGHDYGDALLKEMGAYFQSVVGLRNHCYRMGGDEFILIVTPENYELLNKILTHIITTFNKPWFLIDSECYCTMSMGVVLFPENGTDVNDLIKKADIAMYRAKKSGKNRYEFYKEQSNVGIYRRLEIESNMRQAVESECDEFLVYYQPIVDTDTNDCIGCESLVRWNSKALGFLSPAEFIPLAEYLGLIVEIGDYILEKACLQCKEWNEKYNPDFKVNINLSVVQLLQSNVVEHISEIILSTGVNPQNITLEITENLAINDMERVVKIIEGLKKIGVKIALDDFGTGYSSLNYIKQLAFDIIKIDKSFVDDILTDDYNKAFVKLVVDFSRQIDAKLCVEGVESKDQYKLLQNMKADCIQGYLFSKPIPATEFENKFFKSGHH
ncbi:MAG: EAL domain-containing protein [Lachnospiraceae bacterium]